MINLFDSFSSRISAKIRQSVRPHLRSRALKIAVLGPGLSRNNLGSQKRRKILKVLMDDGHAPFFPERHVDEDNPFTSILTQECELLNKPNVDLVIILHTTDSVGVAMEIARFEEHPRIIAKTAILYPLSLYGDRSLSANTVNRYLVVHPYTHDQLEECRVVGNCRAWASRRRSRIWPDSQSHRF